MCVRLRGIKLIAISYSRLIVKAEDFTHNLHGLKPSTGAPRQPGSSVLCAAYKSQLIGQGKFSRALHAAVSASARGSTDNILLTCQALPLSQASLSRHQAFAAS